MINIKYYHISSSFIRDKSVPVSILSALAPSLYEHSEVQVFEPLQAVSIRNCSLKGRDLVAFRNKYTPFWSIWPHYRKTHLVNEIRQVLSLSIRCFHDLTSIQGTSCSLASHPCWEKNIFHWFLDLLPRVLAAECVAHSPAKVSLLTPGYLLDWQKESLEILGYNNSSLIALPDSPSLSLRAENLVTLYNHRSSYGGRLSFRTHPYIVRTLKQRFAAVKAYECCLNAKRIFILRDPKFGRSFLNIHDIEEFTNTNNFQLVELSSLSLAAQIQLFQNASHIVGAHGAGLTHLIHCTKASIMEIHCSNHGIRSDYFQIASINNLRYYYHVCTPINVKNDMVLDIQVLRDFLRFTSD